MDSTKITLPWKSICSSRSNPDSPGICICKTSNTPGGIPIYFNSVEDKLYVYGVADSAHLPLTVSVLVSIEGIPVERIYSDYGALTGKENNRYNVLAGIPGHLWHKSWIEYLIPEWEDDGSILIELLKSDGRIVEFDLPIPKEIRYPLCD